MLIYSRIKELIICLLLKRLQSSFLRKVSIMHWIIEMWYYGLEEDDLNRSARTVLHILLFIMFCCFGENGWHPRIPICGAQLREQGENAR